VLKLNEITGKMPMQGQIVLLIEDATNTKKLLTLAAKMAKQKEQPFNVNATYILARAAHGLKEVDISEAFYKLYADQSLKLGSAEKLVRAYTGLIDLFYQNKKFDKSVQVCREFLELPDEEHIAREKVIVLRRMVQAMAKQDRFEDALKIVDSLVKAQPDNWL